MSKSTASDAPSWRTLAIDAALLFVTIVALYCGWVAAKRGQLIDYDFRASVHLGEPAH